MQILYFASTSMNPFHRWELERQRIKLFIDFHPFLHHPVVPLALFLALLLHFSSDERDSYENGNHRMMRIMHISSSMFKSSPSTFKAWDLFEIHLLVVCWVHDNASHNSEIHCISIISSSMFKSQKVYRRERAAARRIEWNVCAVESIWAEN